MQYLCVYLAAVNLIAFIAYGVDKARARRGAWRIRERTLIMLALIGGALGAWLGMRAFHHKTKHRKFTVTVPLCALLWGALIAALWLRLR